MWYCSACGEQKSVEMFSSASKGRTRRNTCKACHARKMRAWNHANPERLRANRMRKNWGIEVVEYEAIYRAQNGVCLICDVHLPHHIVDGTGKTRGSIWTCVDHDHVTNEIRGLLCNRCNVGMGAFGDSADRLERAALYLRRVRETA